MSTIDSDKLIRNKIADGRSSPLATYRALTVGSMGTLGFLGFELLTMFIAPLPGGVGYFLRKKLYARYFGSVGRGLILGRNVTIRHPANIFLGDNVTIDDGCLIDGRGDARGVDLGDGAMINRNSMILAKNGPIKIGPRTTIGANSVVVSMSGIVVGESVMFAGGCYLSAGAYRVDGSHGPLMDQDAYSDGPITVGAGAWLGTGAVLLDGVSVGEASVIGAGAVVADDVPSHVIALGVPARVLRERLL